VNVCSTPDLTICSSWTTWVCAACRYVPPEWVQQLPPVHRWASLFSLFSPFANKLLEFGSSSTNRQMTNFCFHDEHTVNGLGKIAWASVIRLMSPCLHVHVSMSLCLHFSMFPWLHVCVCMFPLLSMSPCLHVPISMTPCSTKNGQQNLQKMASSVCFLQT
jgi:hypothetical protein